MNDLIDRWIKDLEEIEFHQICAQPSPQSWSLGQVCMHLLEATGFYLEQIKICLVTDAHAQEEMTPSARIMFQNKEFPDEIIEGPPTNANTPQPANKAALLRSLADLKAEMNDLKLLIAQSASQGKTRHPGLHFLNAGEWYQFAEMHFRHHLRQKKRIEEFLKLKA